jgi:pyruvate dehydrogenase (quinone)
MVLHNDDLNQVTWEQRALGGDPKFTQSQDVEEFSYAAYAELLGFKAIRVDRPEELGTAWEQAFAADRPVLLDIVADPDVPPLPPHIGFEQARHFMFSMARGDEDLLGVVKQATKQFAEGVLPR